MARNYTVVRWVLRLVAVFFCACATVQLNDPDPVAWVLIYSAAAVVTLCSPQPWARWASGAVATTALVWALVLCFTVDEWSGVDAMFAPQAMAHGSGEVQREIMGLLLVALGTGVVTLADRRKPKSDKALLER